MAQSQAKRGRYNLLTPNQLVALHLEEIRRRLELTQDEAARRLEPYTGSRWSKAVFSQAERSVEGKRIRKFTADEIVAFARAFGVPLMAFFQPVWKNVHGRPVRVNCPKAKEEMALDEVGLIELAHSAQLPRSEREAELGAMETARTFEILLSLLPNPGRELGTGQSQRLAGEFAETIRAAGFVEKGPMPIARTRRAHRQLHSEGLQMQDEELVARRRIGRSRMRRS